MPGGYDKLIKQILAVIKKNKTFFIAGHIKPDGDCISAELALILFLKRIGKKVLAVNRDIIPPVYNFLPGIGQLKTIKKTDKKFEVGFFLDSSNIARTGDVIDLRKQVKTVINIDHHIDAVDFGDYNYIDPEASSTCELIYNLLDASPYSLSRAEAVCLYTGIVMDTGGFQQLNTTWRAHQVAAELVKKGAAPHYVSQKLYQNKTASELKLTGLVLATLQLEADGQIAYIKLTNRMYEEAHSSPEETEGLIDYLNSLTGVKILILLKETEIKNNIKISLRSKDKVNVNKIARIFGGGGHKKAAGCTIKGNIIQTQQKILREARRILR
ncbi:MAG: bifunctional oligoribonuclease/PAP phosphatase NrnA [bacterium]